MTSIGKSDGGAVGSWSGSLSTRRGLDDRSSDLDDRRDARAGAGESIGRGPGLHAEDAPLVSARADAFEKRFRAAIRELGEAGEQAGAEQASELAAGTRVLAVAEGSAGTGLPVPAAATTEAPGAREAVVATITQRIEAAIRAETRPSAERPLNLRVDFGHDFNGVTALRLIVTPTTLDVVLERSASGVSDQLIAAAGELAERLQSRFSKRCVRILDGAAGEDRAADPSGRQIHSLSDLFRSNG